MRYFQIINIYGTPVTWNTTDCYIPVTLLVPMRNAPSIVNNTTEISEVIILSGTTLRILNIASTTTTKTSTIKPVYATDYPTSTTSILLYAAGFAGATGGAPGFITTANNGTDFVISVISENNY
jgi:hypothetical protein